MKRNKEQSQITLETVVQRDPEQEFSLIDDEVVMLSLKTGKYYTLNSVGSRIWQLLEKQTTIKDIIKQLVQEYEIEKNKCIYDTISIIEDLVNRSLVIIKRNDKTL